MATSDASPLNPDVTSRSNEVSFLDPTKIISSMSYVNDSLMVTEGQPSSPPPVITASAAGPDNYYLITLDAGRQKSTPVAATFNALTGGANNEYCPKQEWDSSPRQLNFFFAVEITIQSNTVLVYLGQGSEGLSNNWWIGGSCISNSGGVPQLQYEVDGQNVILALQGGENSFTVG